MNTTQDTKAMAYLDEIRTNGVAWQHDIDESRIDAIMAHLRETGRYDLPPVLVLEEGGEHTILDGHHRLVSAKRLDIERIPAWIVPAEEYARIVEEHFGGYPPARIADLDAWIDCDGRSYEDLDLRSGADERR